MGKIISLIILFISNAVTTIGAIDLRADYDYCPSAEEYISPSSWDEQGQIMYITCYTSNANAYTYSGQMVHQGGCASNKANLGKIAYLYTVDTHELVAVLECNDIGGNSNLVNGKALDIWMPDIDACWDFIGEYGTQLFVILREAEG